MAIQFQRRVENRLSLNASQRHSIIGSIFTQTRLQDYSRSPFRQLYARLIVLGEQGKAKTLPPCTGREGTPDFYAMYLPFCEYYYESGIYFCVDTLIPELANPLIDMSLLLNTIAVHELFHFHTELMLGSTESEHTHKSWCRLEEAAANFLAYNWLENTSRTTPARRSYIKRLLFRTVRQGGLEGYGQWDEIDLDSPNYVWDIIKKQKCDPVLYASEALSRSWGTTNQSALDCRMASALWAGLLKSLDTEQVPYFLKIV